MDTVHYRYRKAVLETGVISNSQQNKFAEFVGALAHGT
jgi:hypothetical protein